MQTLTTGLDAKLTTWKNWFSGRSSSNLSWFPKKVDFSKYYTLYNIHHATAYNCFICYSRLTIVTKYSGSSHTNFQYMTKNN